MQLSMEKGRDHYPSLKGYFTLVERFTKPWKTDFSHHSLVHYFIHLLFHLFNIYFLNHFQALCEFDLRHIIKNKAFKIMAFLICYECFPIKLFK